jgi:ligand-binding SRPBCC domain-containing protein
VLSLDHAVVIRAPAATVFDYFVDPAKATVWQSSLVEARLNPAGPIALGTRIAETRRLVGRKLESTVEVTELDPPRLFAGRATAGPVQWQFRHTLVEAEGVTTVRFHLEGEPGGFFRVAGPLVQRAMRRELETDLAALTRLAESESTPQREARP